MTVSDAMPLHRALSAITLPLVVLLFFVVSLSAPVAYFALGKRARHNTAEDAAREAAALVSREVAEASVLWRYDTPKLLRHLWAYGHKEDVAAIEVVDAQGHRIDVGLGDARVTAKKLPLVWARAPITIDGHAVGAVWVAASLEDLRHATLLLLIPFVCMALLLAGTLYFPPLRALRKAEGRIHESRVALADLNASLETQVRERSSALASAYDALQAKETRLRDVSTRALSMQEAERRAVARDLHDTAGQSLTGLRIQLQLLASQAHAPDEVRAMAKRAMDAADASLEDFRRALHQLAPAVLDEAGLRAAIERACDGLGERTGMTVRHHIALGGEPLPRTVQVTCYRIVQESLTNIARHAQARNVTVDLTADEAQVCITIADDGRGMDAEVEGKDGFGLMGMRERVDLLGGTLTIGSVATKGVTVRATLPRVLRAGFPLESLSGDA